MIRTIIILTFIFIPFSIEDISSQSMRYYYFYTPEQIENNLKNNSHDYCRVLCIDESDDTFILGDVIGFDHENIEPTVFQAISTGSVNSIQEVIHCFDKQLNRTYRFRVVNQYTLEVLNHTEVFVKGTKIYLHYQSANGMCYKAFFLPRDLIYSNYWKTGIKNGIFTFLHLGEEEMYYYKDNILVDSIQFSINDSTNYFRRDNFLKRYYSDSMDW